MATFIICCTNNFVLKVTGKQLANHAGVVPFENTCGTSLRGKSQVHFMANKELRTLLTIGAISAVNTYPKFTDYYECKMKEGKKHLQVLRVYSTTQIFTSFSSGSKHPKIPFKSSHYIH